LKWEEKEEGGGGSEEVGKEKNVDGQFPK